MGRNPNSPNWGRGELELGAVRAELGNRREEGKKGETRYESCVVFLVLRF